MNQIRERSHVVLWLLLFFFILSMTVAGLVGGANILNIILGGRDTQLYVGKIGDVDISRQRYQAERDRQLNQMRGQGQTIDNRASLNAGDFAWNTLLERVLKDQKIEELDLRASNDEIYDFLFLTPPPAFQNNIMAAGYFSDDGNFDTDSYQQAVQSGVLPADLNPLLLTWENYLRTYLADRKLQSLYNNLGSVSDESVKNDYIKKNLNCTLDYIYINFSNIADSLVEVGDEQIKERFDKDKKDAYALEERRTMEYVSWKIPRAITSEDSLNAAAVQDSVMQLALEFIAEADFSSFSEALAMFEMEDSDTIDVHEGFQANSGIPFQMGVLRLGVRFAFDSPMGSISDPITANTGLVVFHFIGKKDAGYKELKAVKENIRRTLLREYKKTWAGDYLKAQTQGFDSWETAAAEDDLLEYKSGESATLGGTFPGIGKSSKLTGTLLAMEPGGTSAVIETFSSAAFLHMTAKDEFDEENYQDDYESIRSQLLSNERSRGYSNWLNAAKKEIEIDDFRSLIY